jgi:hypothetical protein
MAKAGSGLSVITLDNDRAGPGELQMILTALGCGRHRAGARRRWRLRIHGRPRRTFRGRLPDDGAALDDKGSPRSRLAFVVTRGSLPATCRVAR